VARCGRVCLDHDGRWHPVGLPVSRILRLPTIRDRRGEIAAATRQQISYKDFIVELLERKEREIQRKAPGWSARSASPPGNNALGYPAGGLLRSGNVSGGRPSVLTERADWRGCWTSSGVLSAHESRGTLLDNRIYC
jgi:hypothetical protein